MNFDISSKLKYLRTQKKMSMKKLSEESGVSTGQISQIESGKVSPSVACLWKLALALDVSINYFFEEHKQCIVQRKGEYRKIVVNQDLNTYEMLSPGKGTHMIDFIKVTLQNNEKYRPEEGITHTGEECGYVLKGKLTVNIDGEDYELEEGDSIYFESTLPHYYLNKEKEESLSIWAMTPRFF